MLKRVLRIFRIPVSFIFILILFGCSVAKKEISTEENENIRGSEYFQSKITSVDTCKSVIVNQMTGAWNVTENIMGFWDSNFWDTTLLSLDDRIIFHSNERFQAGIFELYGDYELRNNGKTLYLKNGATREYSSRICVNQDTMELIHVEYGVDSLTVYTKLQREN